GAGDREGALEASAEAKRRSPGDPLVLLLHARALAAGLDAEVWRVERARLDNQPELAREAALLEGWGGVVATLREAISVCPAGHSLQAQLRLWLANSLLKRIELHRRAGEGSSEELSTDLADLERGIAPLLEGVDPAAIQRARVGLAEALLEGEAERIEAAELVLSKVASPVSSSAAQALLLRAFAGGPDSRVFAQAYCGALGDLPARARMAIARAVADPEVGAMRSHVRHGLLLEASVDLLLWDEVFAFDPEAVTGFGQGARGHLRLAEVVSRAPEWLGFVLAGLREGGRSTELAKRVARDLRAGRGEPNQVRLARALALATPDAPKDREHAVQALFAAREASLGEPSAAAQLLLSRALDRFKPEAAPHFKRELVDALGCARACAPWAEEPYWGLLHATASEDEAAAHCDRLLALGFLDNRAVFTSRPSREGGAVETRRRVTEVLGAFSEVWKKGDALGSRTRVIAKPQFLRCGLAFRFGFYSGRATARPMALRYRGGAQYGKAIALGSKAAFKSIEGLARLEDVRLRRAVRATLHSALSRDDPTQRSQALSSALDWLAHASPAGGSLPHRPDPGHYLWQNTRQAEVWNRPLVRELLARTRPSHPVQGAVLGQSYGVGLPLLALTQIEGAAQSRSHPKLFSPEDLARPWSRSRLLLHGAENMVVQDRAVTWWVSEGAWGETRLAVDRGVSNSVQSTGTRLVNLAFDAFYARAWSAKGAAADRVQRFALGIVRHVRPVCQLRKDRESLDFLAASAHLFQAGRAKPGSPARARLLEQAWQEAGRIKVSSLPRYARKRPFARWQRVRLLGSHGDVAGAKAELEDLLDELEVIRPGRRRRFALAVRSDPLLPLLRETLPEYGELLEVLEESDD
ncbi:MAG: hypothetical protein JKY65_31895, partial [Planctomycetes bacterium]|nr:hypothetical protein [Planctomycetota bacterium]